MQASGFDPKYNRPAIEDIELGYRLRRAERRILLDRDLRVKHLKKWTFWNLVKSDVLDRGIPWTEIILRDQRLPNDLNLQISQRVSIGLVYLMVVFSALRAAFFSFWLRSAAGCLRWLLFPSICCITSITVSRL